MAKKKESARQKRVREQQERIFAAQRAAQKGKREEEIKRNEDRLRQAAETHAAYLARKKAEDALREAQGRGWGGMWS